MGKKDDSCELDTTTANIGQIIAVTGKAGDLTQTTRYKVIAKV